MKIFKNFIIAAATFCAAIFFVACDDDDDFKIGGSEKGESTQVEVPAVTKKVDQFAIDVLETYYLWNKEIAGDIKRLNPDTCTTPIAVVSDIIYRENGKEVDKWTVLIERLSDMESSVQGNSTTFGLDFAVGTISNKPGEYFLLVNYVFKDGPAAKAGIKRGDIILDYGGQAITGSNVYDIFNKTFLSLGVTGLTSEGYLDSDNVKEIPLAAVTMYEDPILMAKTFDVNGDKVGYMVYNSFDLKSAQALCDSCRKLKSAGIEKLILDLRYNGGGYVFTEDVLASLIAPWQNVSGKDIFQKNVYNEILTESFKKSGYDLNEYFSSQNSTTIDGKEVTVDVTDANLNLNDLYVITTSNTASASEGLIIGLQPYMNVNLYGETTFGKFCSGWMLAPEDIYERASDYSLIKEWGMYVMVGKFTNANDQNDAYPAGISPKINVEDNPFDGCQLGDENETMLKAVLKDMGKTYPGGTATRASIMQYDTKHIDHRPTGLSIKSIPGKFASLR